MAQSIDTTPLSNATAQDATRSRSRAFQANLVAYGFMAPAIILGVLFFIIPVILVICLSMTDLSTSNFTSNILEMNFIGLQNYQTLFADPYVPRIFSNTIFYVLITLSVFNVFGGLLVALLTVHINRRAGLLYRALWMLPRITTSSIYVLMWRRLIAEPPYGILNQLNGVLGQSSVNYASQNAWAVVILVNGFIGVSFGMIIFTSAIESIPKDIMNASMVDGSTLLQRIRYVILPLLRWPLLFVVTYQTLSLLTSFEQILLLTNGGPGLYETEVWALTAYHRALSNYFGNAQWGYGSAFAVVLVIVGVALAFLYMRVFRFRDLVADPKIEVL